MSLTIEINIKTNVRKSFLKKEKGTQEGGPPGFLVSGVCRRSERKRKRHTLMIMDRLIDHDEDFKYHHEYKSPKREDETQTDTKEKREYIG
jgi:hypothetical protein